MTKVCNIAALQMSSSNNVIHNLSVVEDLVRATEQDIDILVLPEDFAHMPNVKAERIETAETMGSGIIQDFISRLAQNYGIWVIAGTIPIKHPEHNDKVYASCIVFNELGAPVHRYDKRHLFDVKLPNGQVYCESDSIEYGDLDIANYVDTPWGKVGLSICYDMRFPELYRSMPDEVFINCVSAAFTRKTGEVHWEVLLRARAIENQCYIVASAQFGRHHNGRETWGHSMLVDAWGRVVNCLESQAGIIVNEVDFEALTNIREHFPCLKHKRTHIHF